MSHISNETLNFACLFFIQIIVGKIPCLAND